jgi:hypothetical protein
MKWQPRRGRAPRAAAAPPRLAAAWDCMVTAKTGEISNDWHRGVLSAWCSYISAASATAAGYSG